SNIDKYSTPLVKPLRTRKKVFQNSLESEDILGGNASDMAQSSIWRSGSFLDQKNRKNYDYFYTGTTNMGSYEVLIVEFEPKNTKGNTTGKIYIEQESLAIIQIEYQPIIERYSFWESVSWKEEYDQKDGVFQLVGVTFNGNSLSKNYNYEAILVINESKVISEVPDMELAMNIDDSFFENAEDDFSDSFWTGFNFVKLDSKIYEKL
ncbi:MAG: hypothetical protein HRT61_09020, partial [Ekhidna sp.]|nr:hypothetical protein [Ekhidna sp.]